MGEIPHTAVGIPTSDAAKYADTYLPSSQPDHRICIAVVAVDPLSVPFMNRFLSLLSLVLLLSPLGSAEEQDDTKTLAFLSPSKSTPAFPILTDPAVSGLAAVPAALAPAATQVT